MYYSCSKLHLWHERGVLQLSPYFVLLGFSSLQPSLRVLVGMALLDSELDPEETGGVSGGTSRVGLSSRASNRGARRVLGSDGVQELRRKERLLETPVFSLGCSLSLEETS